MRRLLKIRGRIEFQISDMGEMNPSRDRPDDIRQIILQIRPEGAGAERDAVVDIVHRLQHADDPRLAGDDARQSEYTPCRVIRVNRHLDVILIAHRHDCPEVINQILEQLLLVDVLIHPEQLLHVCHALRFPAWHHGSVHLPLNRIKHFLRMNRVNCLLCVGKHRGPIRPSPGQLRSRPVEYRHEVIADHMDIFPAEILKTTNIIVDIPVPVRASGLDRI